MANATILDIAPTSPKASDNIRREIRDHISAGDTLRLASGIYTEAETIGANKDVVIIAAVGASPIVRLTADQYIKVTNNANVVIKGIKFDGANSSTYAIRPGDVSNTQIRIEDCEFYGFTKNIITSSEGYHADLLFINNCYFHNNKGRACVYLPACNVENQQICSKVEIKNSTFANNDATGDWVSVVDIRSYNNVATDDMEVLVDHCTFYNNITKNHDYAEVATRTINKTTVSNCIFVHGSAQEDIADGPQNARRATFLYAGTVENSLTYNLLEDADKDGHTWMTTRKNTFTADPLFTDSAQGDFSFANNNWVTMSLSPACGVATDGTDLGDPRWHTTAPVLPSVDFATAYELVGTKAVLAGNIRLNANNNIEYYDKDVCGEATWRIHTTKACAVNAIVDMETGSESGCIFQIIAFDNKGKEIGSVLGDWQETDDDISMKGVIYFPAAGDYTIRLKNSDSYSSAKVEKIILSYVGGTAQNIPATLGVSEAWYSAKGSRADGKISFTSYSDSWVKWNIAVPSTVEQTYDVTLTISNLTKYGHNFSVSIYEEGDESNAVVVSEHEWNETFDAENPLPLSLGKVTLDGGKKYVVKVTNAESGANPKIVSVGFAYSGGAVQDLPGTTTITDAWFSPNGTRADGKITFPGSTIQEGWVKWNVAFASAGNYNVTVNVNNTAGHNYTVALYRSESDNTPISVGEGSNQYSTGSPNGIELGAMTIPAGNYILKVTNGTKDSDAKLLSVTFAYAGGSAIDLSKTTSASLLANGDAILSDDWSIESGKIVHAESKALTGWAKWNVDCADNGIYNVIANISCDNGHLVRVEVYEKDAESATYTLDEATATKYSTGDLAINLGTISLEEKEYVFKVSNTVSSSHVQIVSVVVSYVGGALVNLPGTLPLGDALLSTNAYRETGVLHFSDADHKSHVDREWANWNIHASAGVYTFTFNVDGPDYGNYKISVLDGENDTVFTKVKGISKTGFYTTDAMYLDGDYTVQMKNINNYSLGYLTGLSAAASEADVIILDENSMSDADIIAANDQAKTPTLKRSFTGGMFNTICVPFNVSSSTELTGLFGSGFELVEMKNATIEGDVLYLEFGAPASNIAYGRPYLIKPTKDVINPVFRSHTIQKSTNHLVVDGTAAQFIGNFVKQEITVDENDLFLGADNKLYWAPAESEITIKGFRGYFHIKSGSGAPKRARLIMEGGQVATEIELVDGALPDVIDDKVHKLIENGQLVIIRDGVYYNAFGVRVK